MGLADLVAGSVDEYCDIAARLAAEPSRLNRVRGTLRDTMLRAAVMQAERTTRAVEGAFREMWGARVKQT
jgi:predicted O-linked N-acetylglucosamine transferase (SPINDLY family)